MEEYKHVTVLLQEAVAALNVIADGIYIDGTFGRGGHSRLILSKLSEKGHLFGIDRDPEAVKAGLEIRDPRFTMLRGRFSEMPELLREFGVLGKVSGILLDLGVSSPQLDDPRRGFSFMKDGPLDMRMDPDSGISAAEWLNSAAEAEIADVIYKYGEERFSRKIARAIVQDRRQTPFKTTAQLADLISRLVPREPGKNPATRTFQALRIKINGELSEVERALENSRDILAPGGRLAVITFHSLEDHLVRSFLKKAERGAVPPRGIPVPESEIAKTRTFRLVDRGVHPGAEEIAGNPRSRSAILRTGERLPTAGSLPEDARRA